jgi:hypothetical protein
LRQAWVKVLYDEIENGLATSCSRKVSLVSHRLNPSKLVNFLNYAKHVENKATIGYLSLTKSYTVVSVTVSKNKY